MATHVWCHFCATFCSSNAPQRLWLVRGQEKQACVALGLGHKGTVMPSKGAAALGQAVWHKCPALSCKRSQELHGAGSPAASVWLSLLCSFQVMSPTEEILKELCKPALLQMFLKNESLPILWLVLRGLILLSERPETVSRT